jgi:hypothetical protein
MSIDGSGEVKPVVVRRGTLTTTGSGMGALVIALLHGS